MTSWGIDSLGNHHHGKGINAGASSRKHVPCHVVMINCNLKIFDSPGVGGGGGGGDSHMEWTGMLVGNFEFNP